MVDLSEIASGTGPGGKGHICFCCDGIIPQQKMKKIVEEMGYDLSSHGPVHSVRRGNKKGRDYSFWKLYTA